MIQDIPTKADFDNNGIAFLNLAWESVTGISLGLPDQPLEQLGADATEEQLQDAAEEDLRWSEAVEDYWNAAQQELATAVALAHQGTEFLLKGKIAAVSPFLLISGDPKDWPAGCDKADTPFADFKTIDAQDLLRAHDTTCSPRLSDKFKERFEQLRRMRNSVMHTVDRRLKFTTQDCLLAILEMVESLLGSGVWIALRKQHLEREPDFDPYSGVDHRLCRLAEEIVHVVDLLEPAQVKRFFNFDKKQRRYLCPECEFECADWDIRVTLARLSPNAPDSTIVSCILCNQEHAVARRKCNQNGCPGNVISVEHGSCLTCGNDCEEAIDEQ